MVKMLLVESVRKTTELTVARLWLGGGQAVVASGALWSTPRGRTVVSGLEERIWGPWDIAIGLTRWGGLGI